MLSRKIITYYMAQIATLCGQNAEFLSISVGGTRINHRGVNY